MQLLGTVSNLYYNALVCPSILVQCSFLPIGWTAGRTTHNCNMKNHMPAILVLCIARHLQSSHIHSRHALPISFPLGVKQSKLLLKRSSNIERLEPIGVTDLVKATVCTSVRVQASGVSLWASAVGINPSYITTMYYVYI